MGKFKTGTVGLCCICLVGVCLSFVSCCRGQEAVGHQCDVEWNADSAKVWLNDAGISFGLPGDPGSWLVADVRSLPDEVSFVGVDTVSQTCVMFLRLPDAGPVGLMSDSALVEVAHNIMEQRNDSARVAVSSTRGNHAGRDYMAFSGTVAPVAGKRTYHVEFRGAIFDGSARDKMFALVITQPGERAQLEADSIADAVYVNIAPLVSQRN